MMDNFNCKTQVHVRVCEENNLEINVYYIYIIMHAIAEYWPQLVKQVPKSQTRLAHKSN